MRIKMAALGAVLAGVLASTVVAAPAALAAAPGMCTPDPLLCPERIYVGVRAAGLPGDSTEVDAFTEATGVDPSVAMHFMSFQNRVDPTALRRQVQAGRLPMVTWEPFDVTQPSADTFPLPAIAAGQFDAYLSAQGAALAAVEAPVALRFGHEMNGDWYPWGHGVNGNTAADFVAAYRHVHDVVTAAGADNVLWVWSPNLIDFDPHQDLGALYPGDGYVDWVGLSAYFDEATDTYDRLFPQTLRAIDLVAPTKPIYVAEGAVLPGPTRPAMIRDLITGLLATPRLVGFTWFERSTNHDWRLTNDPTAAAAYGAAMSSPYFGTRGHVNDPVAAAPLAAAAPAITGAPRVGSVLTTDTGAWRKASASGPLTLATRWYRCTDTTTASCVGTAAVNSGFGLTSWNAGTRMRVAVTATNSTGTTTVWSQPTETVLMTPATPGAPTVESYRDALKVTFPVRPAGTTHWRVTVNGTAQPLVPVDRTTYWVTGLATAVPHQVGLTAVSSAASATLSSPMLSGTAVPVEPPWNPVVRVSDRTATVTLPSRSPAGATGWRLTVGSVTRDLPLGTTTSQFTGLTAGTATAWSLRALAGTWGGKPVVSLPTSGSFTPAAVLPAVPARPYVEARDGAFRVVFPTPPANATHWKLTVNGVARPLVPVTSKDHWVVGLTNGVSYQLSLAGAVVTATSSAAGPATSGTAVPMPAPYRPYVQASGTTVTVRLPLQRPAGATAWRLTVGSTTRDLPLTTTTSQFTVVRGQATSWSLRALAGTWAGTPKTSATPAAAGTITAW